MKAEATFPGWVKAMARMLTREPVIAFVIVSLGLFALPTAGMVAHYAGDGLFPVVLFSMWGVTVLIMALDVLRCTSRHRPHRIAPTRLALNRRTKHD